MGLKSATAAYVAVLAFLVVFNFLVIYPMSVDLAQAGVSSSTDITGNRTCLTPGGLISGVLGVAILLVLKFFFGQTDPGDPTCIEAFNLLGGNSVLLAGGTVFAVLGGAVLVGGFLTSGSARGGVAIIAFGFIITGATVAALGIVQPIFVIIPYVGQWMFNIFAMLGIVLEILTGLEYLSGSGGS